MKIKTLYYIIISAICLVLASCNVVPSSEDWFEGKPGNTEHKQRGESAKDFALREKYTYTSVKIKDHKFHDTISIVNVFNKDGRTWVEFKVGKPNYHYKQFEFHKDKTNSYIWINDGKSKKNYYQQTNTGIYNWNTEKYETLYDAYWEFDHDITFLIGFDQIPNNTQKISMYIDNFFITVENIKLVEASEYYEDEEEEKEEEKEKELYSYESTTATDEWDNVEIIDITTTYNKTTIKFKLGIPGKVYENDYFDDRCFIQGVGEDGLISDYWCIEYPELDYLEFDSDYIWEYSFKPISYDTQYIDLSISGFNFWINNIKIK